MIPNEEKKRWYYYLAAKHLSALLRRITAKHHGDSYCLNYLHAFRTGNKLTFHKRGCKNKDFRGIAMPPEKDKIQVHYQILLIT